MTGIWIVLLLTYLLSYLLTYLLLCFGAPACRIFPDHLITLLTLYYVTYLLVLTFADVSVPRLAGVSLIT